MPPYAILTRMWLTTAHRMLRTGDVPIATIAGLVGYATLRNFPTAFARHFGVAPSVTRRR